VRLTWTAPAGEPVRYQVKWADKPMLERIDWQTQADTHVNWWAANHVPNEPMPGSAGAKESMVIDGLPAGALYFAIRSFDAASNRSSMSNVARVETN